MANPYELEAAWIDLGRPVGKDENPDGSPKKQAITEPQPDQAGNPKGRFAAGAPIPPK